jgi:hypothetical protein
MTLRTWIYVGITALLLVTVAVTCSYESGVSHGKSIVLVQHDDSVHKADQKAINAQLHVTDSVETLAREALMERDSAQKELERAQAKRDTAKSFATGARALFTLHGDTATVNGLDYVLPVTVSTYIRLSDTANVKQRDLDAIRATAMSNDSLVIARLLGLNAQKDTVISLQKAALDHDEGEIKDLKAEKSPRFGLKSGLVAGASLAVLILHFIR